MITAILRTYPEVAFFLILALVVLLGPIKVDSFKLTDVAAVLFLGMLMGQFAIPITFIKQTAQQAGGEIVFHYPVPFASIASPADALPCNQAAGTKTIMPVTPETALPPSPLMAVFPPSNGDFLLPDYQDSKADIAVDRNESVKIGKSQINYRYMM